MSYYPRRANEPLPSMTYIYSMMREIEGDFTKMVELPLYKYYEGQRYDLRKYYQVAVDAYRKIHNVEWALRVSPIDNSVYLYYVGFNPTALDWATAGMLGIRRARDGGWIIPKNKKIKEHFRKNKHPMTPFRGMGIYSVTEYGPHFKLDMVIPSDTIKALFKAVIREQ